MKSATSRKSQYPALPRIRELVRLQQALHHNLVQLQQRTAGLAPRQALNQMYWSGQIDGDEYLTIMLATGLGEEYARDMLSEAHGEFGPTGQTDPATGVIEPDLPEYSLPTRVVRRPGKRGNELRGHPLD